MPSIPEILALVIGSYFAGAMNSIAGGGTIITFPILIAFGMPAIEANATSTVALLVGIGGSLYGYRSNLPTVRPWLKIFAPLSMAGGILGAWLLIHTSEKAFAHLVPFLILFATVLFLCSNGIRRMVGLDGTESKVRSAHIVAACLLQFGVAIYGGYFGAGIGILTLATLGLIGKTNILEMNTIKTVLGASINLVAASYFVWSGIVIWPEALIMTLGAGIGYYSGAVFSMRITPDRVRTLIIVIGFVLSAIFFWRQYAP